MSDTVKRVVITGATGFVGAAFVSELNARFPQWSIVTLGRTPCAKALEYISWSFDDYKLPTELLVGVDVVVHLAARAHQLSENKTDDLLPVYRGANVVPTLSLAESARAAGVKHFIYMSSIGVHGDQTFGEILDEKSPFRPSTPYAASKLEAEQALFKKYEKTAMSITNLRPPLVYSAAAPGNFEKLLKLASKNIMLPVGSAYNKRNMVALENLIDMLVELTVSTPSSSEAYLVADDEAVSLQEIISCLRAGQGRGANICKLPVGMMQSAAWVLGKQKMFSQLFGDLQVSNRKARTVLGWSPVISAKEALINTGKRFKEMNKE